MFISAHAHIYLITLGFVCISQHPLHRIPNCFVPGRFRGMGKSRLDAQRYLFIGALQSHNHDKHEHDEMPGTFENVCLRLEDVISVAFPLC